MFDIMIPMPEGAVFALYVKHANLIKMANTETDIKKMTIQQAHE